MDIECVFFDAGDTLIYPDPPVGEVYAEALRRRGIPARWSDMEGHFRSVLADMRARRDQDGADYGPGDRQARRWWREVVRLSFEPFGVPDSLDEVFEELWEHFASPEVWRVYADVFPTLGALRGMGLRLGLVSNWDSRLAPLLQELGIRDRLDACTISCEVGVEKPDARIFARALEACGVAPHRAAHVGDSYTDDVMGAVGAEMLGVWLRRDGTAGPATARSRVIASLDELPDLLAGHSDA